MPIGKVEHFDLASKKWSVYIRRVDQFIKLNEIKAELHVATLVTLVGQPTYDLMSDLCAPDNPEVKSYEDLVKIVGDHLEPQLSEIAERHVFRHRPQRAGESMSEYLQALKHLASTCNFGTQLEINLRDQFVSGLANEEMKSRLYAEPSLTYKRAVELSFALEAAERHAQTGSAAEPLHRAEVRERRVGAGGGGVSTAAGSLEDGAGRAAGRSSRACWRCGRNHRAETCRFRNYSCDICNKKGHLKSMCKVNKSDIKKHNYIVQSDEDDSECDLYSLKVCGKNDMPYLVKVNIGGKQLSFELDTGSKLSTINLDCYKQHFKDFPLTNSNICLRSYTGSLIEPVGYFKANVGVGDKTAENLKLFVIKKGGPPLLGRSWLGPLNIENVLIKNIAVNNLKESNIINELKAEFPTVFSPKLGNCSKKIKLHLMDNTPVFYKARSLPLALRGPVERELRRLEAEGTIYKVDYSDYGTPIVPIIKKSGDIRICGDYKVTINPKLVREPYPLPRIEELFAALSGGVIFSKIDLTYQQLFLSEESQACTAITTHVGTFVYKRTPFGLTCIPEKFQKFMEETLRGLRGVTCFLDDIAVTGLNIEDHISNLKSVFERLRQVDLRIKFKKCSFLQDSITYVGFIIDKTGLHPDPNKINAIVNAPAPSDVTQLRSFLGLVNYYAKFIPNLSTTLHPLHKLLRKNVDWVWTVDCEKAFKCIKNHILGKNVLVHYDPNLPLIISVDSSSYGIASVLSHRYPNGEERPICFASRTLNSAEQGYSQLDKEALAIFSGVVKHHQYLYGRHFTIKSDHKPLTFIFGSKVGLPQTAASRLQRYATRLAAYSFDIEFVKSKDNGNVDALSRLPLPCKRNETEASSYIHYVEESFPISAKEVALQTQKDLTLQQIYTYILKGWPSSVDREDLKPYSYRKNSLSIDNGYILYNYRVVIPEVLRKSILKELHDGHLGIVKMKNIARGYVYWPQLDQELETLCGECVACRQQRDAPPRAVLHPWAFPARPWQRLHIDFGEFQGKHYLVTVDAHTKWIEVQKMAGTTASAVILKLRELFARFGLPAQIVSDGGPPFSSQEFSKYMSKNLISHTITSPYRPVGNGAAENAVKSVKRAMKKGSYEGVDAETALAKFLFQYRNCEHTTTGVAPSVAMFGRSLRGRLDALRPGAEGRVEVAQERMGQYSPGAERSAQVGDEVLARDYRPGTPKWASATVTDRQGPLTYRVKLTNEELSPQWQRHIDQIITKPPRKSMSLARIEHAQSPNDVRSVDHGKFEGNNENTLATPPVTPPVTSPNSVEQQALDRHSSSYHDGIASVMNEEDKDFKTVKTPRKCTFKGRYGK